MAKLVEKQNKLQVTFKKLDIQMRHEVHGTVNLELINPEGMPGNNIRSTLELSDLPALRKHGWNKPYLPKMYVWPNIDINKFYIAGELPPSFLKFKGEVQQKALEAWGKTILQLLYQYDLKDFGLNLYKGNDPKLLGMNKLKATAFPLSLEYVEKNAYDLSAKSGVNAFIQIGDAAKNANFYLGHGTNDAIADGIEVAKSLKADNSIDMKQLQEHHLLKKQDVVTEMENARFYASESEMAVMGEAEKHYLSELTKLSQEAKKIVADVLKPQDPKYKEIMEGFTKITALVQSNNDARFEDIYKITMEIFDEMQGQLRVRHYALVMGSLITQDYHKLLHREAELKREINLIKHSIEAEPKKSEVENKKESASIAEASRIKADSDKFLENVSKWHSNLVKPSERLERISQLEKEMKEIVDKKVQSAHKQEPLLDRASNILNQFSGTAKYLKESRQLKAQLAVEQAKREKQDNPALEQEQQATEKTPSESLKKESVVDTKMLASTKEPLVKQLIKSYEQLHEKNEKEHSDKKQQQEIPSDAKKNKF